MSIAVRHTAWHHPAMANTPQVAFRLPSHLATALDAYLQVLNDEAPPGLSYNRSDALVALLTRALDQTPIPPTAAPTPPVPAKRATVKRGTVKGGAKKKKGRARK
jgi:hypothetical protein